MDPPLEPAGRDVRPIAPALGRGGIRLPESLPSMKQYVTN
jgi:hypothetical protein